MLVPEVVLATQQAAAFIKQGGIAPHRCRAAALTLFDLIALSALASQMNCWDEAEFGVLFLWEWRMLLGGSCWALSFNV
jgi:hypothetical protein